MNVHVIDIADADHAFAEAAAAIDRGEVIVLPTDTVYGVGANATDADAVQRLLDAKERGRDMPPPVLVADAGMVPALATGVDERVRALGEAFWPGALTLVLPTRPTLRMDLGDRGDTIAVRVPDHDFTRELLRRTGPLAVSSANVHGHDAALTIDQATAQLGERCSVYLDGGTMGGPVASTIVDLSQDRARVLRAGRITAAQLNEVCPGLVEEPDEAAPGDGPDADPARAPEQTDGASEQTDGASEPTDGGGTAASDEG